MGGLPLSLIPTFAVPLWTIAHIISLIQLRRAEVANDVVVRAEAASPTTRRP
jgi:hypothetical protein